MQIIQLTEPDLTPHVDDAFEGQFLDGSQYDRVISDDATVLKPDGTTLLVYVRHALPRSICRSAFDAFKHAPLSSSNRGMAAGGRFRPLKQDGTRSRTLQSKPKPSGVVGFLDAEPRYPACRKTALTREHVAEYQAARPFFVAASNAFKSFAPERWAAQREFIDRVSPDFYIPRTVFTTVTVNRSWRTAAHFDAEDFRPGFGVMATRGRSLRWRGTRVPEVPNRCGYAHGRYLSRRCSRTSWQRTARRAPA